MATTAALFGALFAVLAVLELVDAVLSSVLDAAGARGARSPAFAALAVFGWLGTTIGLVFHELAHAAAQTAFGGRPSIVLLKNGGLAQSRPWLPLAPFKVVHVLGQSIGMGIIGIAPALAASAALGAFVLWASPLSVDAVAAAGRAVVHGGDVETARGVAEGVWHLVAAGPWWMWLGVGLVVVLIGPCMTPSTVDYTAATPSLVGYGVGAVAVTRAGLVGAIAAGGGALLLLLLLHSSKRLPGALGRLLGAIMLSTPVVWLALRLASRRFGYEPVELLQSGLVVTTMALAFAAAVQAVYVTVMVVLAVLSHPMIVARALWVLPRHLLDLVRPFSTCAECRVHYRGRCDGCGRTPDGPAPPRPDAPPPRKKGFERLLSQSRGERTT
jgi:hypothetical protein